jgi:hypothetical protein
MHPTAQLLLQQLPQSICHGATLGFVSPLVAIAPRSAVACVRAAALVAPGSNALGWVAAARAIITA